MKRNFLVAVFVSVVVTLPLPLFSMSVASGSLSEVLVYPGFWKFYAGGFAWFLLCGVLASFCTLLFTRERAHKSR